MIETRFSRGEVDILMIAEGTYPFVRGGVASWIADMIKGMPEYRFGIIFLGAYQGMYEQYAFPLPDNLLHLQIVYLFESKEPHSSCPVHPQAKDRVNLLHANLHNSHEHRPGLIDPLDNLNELMSKEQGFDYHQFLRCQESWDLILQNYKQYSTNPSFINYFWNIRNMHEPLWTLVDLVGRLPPFKAVHTISTGYAGFLAVLIKQAWNKPIILTEHGLYSKERNIELLQTSMFANINPLLVDQKTMRYEHQLWLRFYDSLARMCYQEALSITSLFEGARLQQIAAGAAAEKTRVIPNGINIKQFKDLRRNADKPVPKIICFVGRVVRIKDVMTYLRAIELMVKQDPEVQGWIKAVGEGDEEYIQECREYIRFLGINDHVHFISHGGMREMLAQSGILALSSISEGMPLVLLEAMAAGIPVIATDVGACREMIEGNSPEDRALGACGAIVSIADAENLAREALRIFNQPGCWQEAQAAGIERVENYYNQPLMFQRYQQLYQEAFSWQE